MTRAWRAAAPVLAASWKVSASAWAIALCTCGQVDPQDGQISIMAAIPALRVIGAAMVDLFAADPSVHTRVLLYAQRTRLQIMSQYCCATLLQMWMPLTAAYLACRWRRRRSWILSSVSFSRPRR